MDTSIYIGLGLKILPQTVDVWVDAPCVVFATC